MSGTAGTDPYRYRDPASGVLRNLLGITDAGELARAEASLSASRLIDLERRRLPGGYDLDHLRAFHRWIGWPRPAGVRPAQSFEAARLWPRAAGPGRPDRGLAGADRVVPHRLDDGARPRCASRRDFSPRRSHHGESVVAELGQDVAGPADDLAGERAV